MTNIHYVEFDATHPDSFVFDVPNGHDCWLLVMTKTPALFFVDGQLTEYPSHSAVLFKPHQKIYYCASKGTYCNNWIRFESTESFVTEPPLPYGIPFPIEDPAYCHMLYQLLVAEHTAHRGYSESSVEALLQLLFNKMRESCHRTDITPQYHQLLLLRREIQNNPARTWTVPMMAASMHVSPGYLQAIYKANFGLSCMDDVIHSRIRLAKEYLSHDTRTVAEVAILCGYRNVEHFCRQFKKLMHTTPRGYCRGVR